MSITDNSNLDYTLYVHTFSYKITRNVYYQFLYVIRGSRDITAVSCPIGVHKFPFLAE